MRGTFTPPRGRLPGSSALRHRPPVKLSSILTPLGCVPTLWLIFCLLEVHTGPRDSESIAKVPSFLRIAPNSQSRPIAIEPPAGGGADSISASASIPLEPLSARGDLPGYIILILAVQNSLIIDGNY